MTTDLTSFTQGGLAVVAGATGGIGSALLQRIEACGRFDQVEGLARSLAPGFDLEDEESIAAAAARISAAGELRLFIDATGLLSDARMQPEKALRQIDPAAMERAFRINAIGPALMIKHFAPLFPREGKSVFATLSAKVGSIGDNRLGGWISYRASKAALNQIVRTASIELARRQPELLLLALHPGTVDTGLSRPFARAGLTVRTPDEAAGRLLAVIDAAGREDSGAFLSHDGERLPF
ncbi:SDR family NAD(P)-dependent oxidoreductase [Stappia sp. 28M-7]|uniref:SDR family NAD(P)-dependent oxidoreductase n=1 Tax=Stappia sp. 28M-7 TaxID=2762596 RepID=UPI00163C28EE|nr:SDR family NAD(P)-dependent oxidoreductase [Stappia sp. 28M-7]MBC2860412.1 SDR family NAD(P)-dependent oxidoreductase [Stappia sp. 28M-7]